jgi:alpha-N-arabinofuranosidase
MDQPLQGTGHAELFEDHEGRWWMVFLGFRPVGGGYWHHLGRETNLAPVTWSPEGWPVVNGGEPVGLEMSVEGLPAHPSTSEPVREEFDRPPGPVWNHLRNPERASYATLERPGWLTLHGTAATLAENASPTFVGRRQQHLSCRIATRVEFAPTREGEEAGLVLYRHPFHRYEVGLRAVNGTREVFLRQTIGPSLSAVTASAPVPGDDSIILVVDAAPTEYAFSWGRSKDDVQSLGTAPTRFLSSEVAGGFVGTYAGLYATGHGEPAEAAAHFDWFDYEPRDDGEPRP